MYVEYEPAMLLGAGHARLARLCATCGAVGVWGYAGEVRGHDAISHQDLAARRN